MFCISRYLFIYLLLSYAALCVLSEYGYVSHMCALLYFCMHLWVCLSIKAGEIRDIQRDTRNKEIKEISVQRNSNESKEIWKNIN